MAYSTAKTINDATRTQSHQNANPEIDFPAKAGTQCYSARRFSWAPAFAGDTNLRIGPDPRTQPIGVARYSRVSLTSL
jgi:hypothetical protein